MILCLQLVCPVFSNWHPLVEGDYVDEDEDEEELEDLGLSPEAIEQALATSGRNFDDSDSETDENASTSLFEESQESGVESDSDAASELAIFQVSFFFLVLI